MGVDNTFIRSLNAFEEKLVVTVIELFCFSNQDCFFFFFFLTLHGNTNQRRAIFSHLKNQNATIFNLQETFSKQDNKKIWSAEWGGKNSLLSGLQYSKGVSVLINPKSKFQLSAVETDPHGRFIIAKL